MLAGLYAKYQKNYRENYGEKMRVQIREWFQKNPNYLRKWLRDHPLYFKKRYRRMRNWYLKQNKSWLITNKERRNKYMREYMKLYRNGKNGIIQNYFETELRGLFRM
jgi:hypothetical protein